MPLEAQGANRCNGGRITHQEKPMIIAMTSFTLPAPITPEEARAIFLSTAPKYRDVPGLYSKHYILSSDGGTVGGVYVWHSRIQAEDMYTDAWRAFVREKYGTEPVVAYFDCPVVVDNVARTVITDA
jgi:hypothetical protein